MNTNYNSLLMGGHSGRLETEPQDALPPLSLCAHVHLCVHHSLKASDLPLPSSTAYYAAICFAQRMRQQTAVDMPWITKQLFLGLYPLLLNIHMSVYISASREWISKLSPFFICVLQFIVLSSFAVT